MYKWTSPTCWLFNPTIYIVHVPSNVCYGRNCCAQKFFDTDYFTSTDGLDISDGRTYGFGCTESILPPQPLIGKGVINNIVFDDSIYYFSIKRRLIN